MEILLETRNLKTLFPIRGGVFQRRIGNVRAVDDIDLTINKRQWMGLVGESGCGKTTLGKTVLRLLTPTSGHIYLDVPEEIKGQITELETLKGNSTKYNNLLSKYDLAAFPSRQLKPYRKKMQIVHQDPFTSLDPRMKIQSTLLLPINSLDLMQVTE